MPSSRRVGSLGSVCRASLGNSDGSRSAGNNGEERRARVAQQLALGVLILASRLCFHYRRCSFAPLAALSQARSPRAGSDPRASTAPSAASASVRGPEALGRCSARRSELLAVVAGGGLPPVPALSRSIIRHFLVISVPFFVFRICLWLTNPCSVVEEGGKYWRTAEIGLAGHTWWHWNPVDSVEGLGLERIHVSVTFLVNTVLNLMVSFA